MSLNVAKPLKMAKADSGWQEELIRTRAALIKKLERKAQPEPNRHLVWMRLV